jgi:hypothetical protein
MRRNFAGIGSIVKQIIGPWRGNVVFVALTRRVPDTARGKHVYDEAASGGEGPAPPPTAEGSGGSLRNNQASRARRWFKLDLRIFVVMVVVDERICR